MAKKKKTKPAVLSEQLREIILSSDLSRYRIAKDSGVDASQLHRFVNGQGRLTTDSLDAIGQVLGLEFKVKKLGRG